MSTVFRTALLVVFSLPTAACVESGREQATGDANFRAVNAIVGAPNAEFLLEEVVLDAAAYRTSIPAQRFDDLNFEFRFQLRLPGEATPRVLARESVDIQDARDYLFVLDGTVANADILVWDTAERQFDATETVFEIVFGHLNNAIGPVDVFFAPPGTTPVAGSETATLADGERLPAMEFEQGDYELILTPAGDPQTILYTSGSRNYTAGTTDNIIIFDRDPSLTADVSLRQISAAGLGVDLPDPRFAPQAQFVHAAFATGNVDVAENANFSPPLVTNLAFGERTTDINLSAGAVDVTFTDTGNPGAILAEDSFTNNANARFSRVLIGPPGDLAILDLVSNRRPFSTNPRLTIVHAASTVGNVDVYLLPAGESVVDNLPALSNVPFSFVSGAQIFAPDAYELTLTLPGEDTIVGGPLAINLPAGVVVEALFVDTNDPNLADILVTDQAP